MILNQFHTLLLGCPLGSLHRLAAEEMWASPQTHNVPGEHTKVRPDYTPPPL